MQANLRLRSLRSPLAVFFVALSIRLLIFFISTPWALSSQEFVSAFPDSGSYREAAEHHMVLWGVGDSQTGLGKRLHEMTNRPLGIVIIWIAVILLVGSKELEMFLLLIILNIFLDSISSLIIFYISFLISKSTKIGVFNSLLYTLNPYTALWCLAPLSEVLFIFVSLISVLIIAILFFIKYNKMLIYFSLFFLLGLTLVLAASIRTGLLYLAPILGIICAFYGRSALNLRMYGLLAFFLGFALIYVFWIFYQIKFFYTAKTSLSGEIHLLHYASRLANPKDYNAEFARLQQRAFERMRQDGIDPMENPFSRGPYYREVVREIYEQDKARFIGGWLKGMGRFWTQVGQALPERIPGFRENISGFVKTMVLIFLVAYHYMWLVLAAIGLWFSFRKKEFRIWFILFIISSFYFTLVSGWDGSYRYRMQIIPFASPIIAIALSSLSGLVNRETDSG